VRARTVLVTAARMQRVEAEIFARGMPVAALMEKVGLALAAAITCRYPAATHRRVGVLVGPGHNGGDALVVARELWLAGRQVVACFPLSGGKELTLAHRRYFAGLGGTVVDGVENWPTVDLWIDGLFGFGLVRPLAGAAADAVEHLNRSEVPVVALDLPSGLDTDTGAVLGTAVRAHCTLCIGLWKRGLWQEGALPYTGECERIDFGITDAQLAVGLADETVPHLLDDGPVRALLPLARSPLAHKYTVGTTLVIAGSARFGGAPQLTALGARASGTGMLTLAVPAPLRSVIDANFPEAVLTPCPVDAAGIIADLPVEPGDYDAVVFGPGLGKIAPTLLERVVRSSQGALVLDADGLNTLAGRLALLGERPGPTVLTPHLGEFRRLFPQIDPSDRFSATSEAARSTGAWIVFKGARTVIAAPDGRLWVNGHASSALARGGSGDVLAGLVAGLAAQTKNPESAVLAAVWWHARTGEWLARRRTVLGVTPQELAAGLIDFLGAET